MVKEFTQDDDDLLAELGVDVEIKKAASRTPREERIIAGFEEIQRFTTENGSAPQHGEKRDIFERLYAVRLDQIRDQQECRDLVEPLDTQGLLAGAAQAPLAEAEELDDDALLAELGIDVEAPPITELKHVRSAADHCRGRVVISPAGRLRRRCCVQCRAVDRAGSRSARIVCAQRWRTGHSSGRSGQLGQLQPETLP